MTGVQTCALPIYTVDERSGEYGKRHRAGHKTRNGKGVKAMVSALRDLEIPEEIIEQKIREKFDFSSEEAKQYIHQ